MRVRGAPGAAAPPALRRVLARAAESLRRFRSDRRGGIAMMFGIGFIPAVLMIGVATDYSLYVRAKADADAVADMAALSVVNRSGMKLDQPSAKAQADRIFRDAVASVRNVVSITADSRVTDTNGTRTATVPYTLTIRTNIMQIAGIGTLTVSGTSTASSPSPVFMDFYLLLDNSPSMGVGATLNDIATMVANTGSDKCAFACHDLSKNGSDYYALAKQLGVTMRIDVVRQATQKLIDTANAKATVSGQYRTAVYTMGTSCSGVGLTTVSSLTSNLTRARSDSDAIDLMTVPYQNYNNDQCTDYDGVLSKLDGAIPKPGDGSSPDAPQKVVFFVSDGVADAYYPATCSRPTSGGRCQEPITLAGCKTLKDRGVKVAVLYTTYLPLPTNSWYNTWIAPFSGTIGTQMQACASDGLYFEVSPTQGIADAMLKLFEKVLASQTRLTQ